MKKWKSVTSHDLYPPPPPPVTNCHTFSDPLPLWSVTYFMDGPLPRTQNRAPRAKSESLTARPPLSIHVSSSPRVNGDWAIIAHL